MRHTFISIVLALCLAGVAGAAAVIGDLGVATAYAQEIEIQIGQDPWYQQPVWIAIAALAAVVVIMLIVMAARGRGTRV